jgi:hypothetical protein
MCEERGRVQQMNFIEEELWSEWTWRTERKSRREDIAIHVCRKAARQTEQGME